MSTCICVALNTTARAKPSALALRGLHRQHLFTVPFENLDIALETTICLDLSLIYEKIVRQHRGGFCYELNALFANC
jgi:N-hydroxyarylamine O-acetyltransferase